MSKYYDINKAIKNKDKLYDFKLRERGENKMKDNIRDLLYKKLEDDFNNDNKQSLSIQQYILELEKFLVNN